DLPEGSRSTMSSTTRPWVRIATVRPPIGFPEPGLTFTAVTPPMTASSKPTSVALTASIARTAAITGSVISLVSSPAQPSPSSATPRCTWASMNPGSSQFPPASTMRAPSGATTSGPSSMIVPSSTTTVPSKAGEEMGRTWALVIARTVMRSTLALPRENVKQDTAVGCRRVGPAGARLRRIRAREHPAGVDTACANLAVARGWRYGCHQFQEWPRLHRRRAALPGGPAAWLRARRAGSQLRHQRRPRRQARGAEHLPVAGHGHLRDERAQVQRARRRFREHGRGVRLQGSPLHPGPLLRRRGHRQRGRRLRLPLQLRGGLRRDHVRWPAGRSALARRGGHRRGRKGRVHRAGGRGLRGTRLRRRDGCAGLSTMRIELGRVRDLLDDGGSADGEHRVLVDRLWPRGIAKERLAYDAWDKDIAPSPELRKAFHAGELDFEQFREHYLGELSDSDAPRRLLEAAADAEASTIVLVYAAKDVEHNHARVLREAL